MKKIRIKMIIAVHPLKAEIWKKIMSGKLKTGMSYREIGKIIGEKSPQKVKHHLEVMKNMGAIDYISGEYNLKIPKI